MNSLSQDVMAGIDKMLQDQPGVVLETVARTHGVTLADVVARLPASEHMTVPGSLFVTVMEEISSWGKLTTIVNTPEMVLEAKGPIGKGSMGRGYYNIPGAIGGHFKPGEFHAISFITRTLMGKPSRSILFFNTHGSCVFKLYLGRQENREMIPEQVEKFDQLIALLGKKERISGAA
ncbi:MAG: heme utilization cystosolic carrier protein HutX [Pseudomonadota bacterium]